MFEPDLIDPESLKTYPQKVISKQHNCEAQSVIANWPFSEAGWSDLAGDGLFAAARRGGAVWHGLFVESASWREEVAVEVGVGGQGR
jgi:hypothetical protein